MGLNMKYLVPRNMQGFVRCILLRIARGLRIVTSVTGNLGNRYAF